jgi:hypothetical protein
MFEFMDYVNQELKQGEQEKACQDKLIERLIMQGPKSSSSVKKLAKVNI